MKFNPSGCSLVGNSWSPLAVSVANLAVVLVIQIETGRNVSQNTLPIPVYLLSGAWHATLFFPKLFSTCFTCVRGDLAKNVENSQSWCCLSRFTCIKVSVRD